MKDPRDVHFGKALRELRRAKGLSMDALAAKTGITANHIGVLERGEKGALVRTLDDLAKALECSHNDFFRYFFKGGSSAEIHRAGSDLPSLQ